MNNDLQHTLKHILMNAHIYTTYYDTQGSIKKLIELGYLSGRGVGYGDIRTSGFFTVTELGKIWLEFNEL